MSKDKDDRLVIVTLTSLAAQMLLIVQPAAAQGDGGSVPPPGPDWDMVAFEVKSWGAPVSSWTVLSNGGGSWLEAQADSTTPVGEETLVWHEIKPDVGQYIAIEQILRKLPDPAPDPNNCANFMPDMAYGTIRLTRGATTTEIAWNSGCLDTDYTAFMDVLKSADQTVAAWGREGDVLRSEKRGR